jgi:MyTH4 domain
VARVQTRGNPEQGATAHAWQLFFLVASTAPPSKEFTGLVSEYVHAVCQGGADTPDDVRRWAQRAWAALKRSAKAGARRTVGAAVRIVNPGLLCECGLHSPRRSPDHRLVSQSVRAPNRAALWPRWPPALTEPAAWLAVAQTSARCLSICRTMHAWPCPVAAAPPSRRTQPRRAVLASTRSPDH